jgi:3-oxoacyl-[acyl-carrier-protein] synthase-3
VLRVQQPSSSELHDLKSHKSRRTQKLLGIGVSGIGAALPDQIVTNEDLKQQYGMDPDWIEQRTGIRERRRARPGESTSTLAVTAARNAIENAGISAADIDLIVLATFTPDYRGPSSACLVQAALGLNAPAFDVQAACAGFMYALATAGQYVATGNSKLALVIGSDVVSHCCDAGNRATAPLFGDGAGAVLLEAGRPDQGLVSYQLGSDGSLAETLLCPVGGSMEPATPEAVSDGRHFLQMEGRRVYKWAVETVTESIALIIERSNVSVDDISLFVLHQANIRIIDHAMKELGIPAHKVVNNLDRVGNTSAASIPLVLAEAQAAGRLKSGELVMMCGFGAGLTWGTGLFRW